MDADRGAGWRRGLWLLLPAAAVAGVLAVQACFFETGEVGPRLPPEAASHLRAPQGLAPFFAALDRLERHHRDRAGVVRILQIGDSHTANDALSGRMRERFQGRFGGAGRGWLPAGIPFKYYRPALVSVSESGWAHFRPASREPGTVFGLDAVDARSKPPDAVMAIESTEREGFDYVAVEFLARPEGSPFTVQVDDAEPVRVATAARQTEIRRFELPLSRNGRRVELRAGGRPPVDLLGWAVERRTAGVIYENHGTIGATVGILGQMTPAAVAAELNMRRPALLIVAFGTNEGFDDALDPRRYAARFDDRVAGLQRQAGGVPVLILGAPDGNRAERGCTATACRADGADDSCAWRAPIHLAAVRAEQQAVSDRRGWAYWDWFGAMGGVCSIDRLASAGPPRAMPDHVHLNTAGYRQIADMLFADLMTAYDRWRARSRVG